MPDRFPPFDVVVGVNYEWPIIWSESRCLQYIGRTIAYPRGKVLGGCSSINGMIYMRGQEADFAHWVKAAKGDDAGGDMEGFLLFLILFDLLWCDVVWCGVV